MDTFTDLIIRYFNILRLYQIAMDYYQTISVSIYAIGLILWFILWKLLIGYDWINKIPKLRITLFGGAFALIANLLLTTVAEIPEYTVELGIYSYVERNATVK